MTAVVEKPPAERPEAGRGFRAWNGGDHWAMQWYAPGLFLGHHDQGSGPEQIWFAPRPWKGHLTSEQLLEHIRKMYFRASYVANMNECRVFPVIIPNPTFRQVVRNYQLKKEGWFALGGLVTILYAARFGRRWDPTPGTLGRMLFTTTWVTAAVVHSLCYVRSWQRLVGYQENDFELAVYGPAFPAEVEDLRRRREDKILRKKMVYDILESGSNYFKAISWENPLVQRHHAMYVKQIREWEDAVKKESDHAKDYLEGKLAWRDGGSPLLDVAKVRAREQAEQMATGEFKSYLAAPGLAGERLPSFNFGLGAPRSNVAAAPLAEKPRGELPVTDRAPVGA